MSSSSSPEAAVGKPILLLVFVHGFKGNDQTFASFPSHLAALLIDALPRITVHTAVYPSFETRGELPTAVSHFREWLLNRVIDLEVERGTPSPTVAPGVKTVLVGHSMGGIVSAEAVLSIARDAAGALQGSSDEETKGDLFPAIQGVLAFDTPYLGIAPSVVARNAEDQWTAGKAWYDSAADAWAQTPWGKAAAAPKAAEAIAAAKTANATTSAGAAWGWGKYAAIAGAASAVVAGTGAAAYLGKDKLTGGWSWVGSHLEFVGCLARGEELRQRLDAVGQLRATHGVGFANLFTLLGPKAGALPGKSSNSLAAQVLGNERTFCNVPKSPDAQRWWQAAKNDKAGNEIEAHMNMFVPEVNPGYYKMGDEAKRLVVTWVRDGWREAELAIQQ